MKLHDLPDDEKFWYSQNSEGKVCVMLLPDAWMAKVALLTEPTKCDTVSDSEA